MSASELEGGGTPASTSPPAAGCMYPSIKLYVLEGSQFCAKVIAALESRRIPYTNVYVPFLSKSARAKKLPSGGHMVPEMTLQFDDDTSEVVPDSAAILRRLDKLMETHGPPDCAPFVPTEEIAHAEAHIGSVVNGLVLYFNHVSDAGWARSIRSKMRASLPVVLRDFVPYAALMAGVRAKYRENVKDVLAVGEKDVNDAAMRKRLEFELKKYDDVLAERGAPKYLYGTPAPSAADVSLYAMVARFVGTMGDAELPPALPDLWQVAEPGLKNLKTWYAGMEKEIPLTWKKGEE